MALLAFMASVPLSAARVTPAAAGTVASRDGADPGAPDRAGSGGRGLRHWRDGIIGRVQDSTGRCKSLQGRQQALLKRHGEIHQLTQQFFLIQVSEVSESAGHAVRAASAGKN